ncbi:MAG: helix-turn-helix domain-containing protein [Candidatus Ornithospirochaeta sp.]
MNKEKDKSHLCIGDRVEIATGLSQKRTATEIAARIGCAKTTVSREVKGHYSVVLESDENGQMGMRTFSWTNNLLIMTACKTDEEKEFYIRACIENHYLFSLTRSI